MRAGVAEPRIRPWSAPRCGTRLRATPVGAGKGFSWHTRLQVLGWTIDTVALTISLPPAKLVQLRELLARWPADRRISSESELRSLMARLLHVCQVVRQGKKIVRRMLNQLGLPPVPAGAEEPWGSRGRSRGRIRLEREFHDDLSFWCLMVDTAVGPGGSGTLGAPLLNLYLQPH